MTLKKNLKVKIQEWERTIAIKRKTVEDGKAKITPKIQQSSSYEDVGSALRIMNIINDTITEIKVMERWLGELKELVG